MLIPKKAVPEGPGDFRPLTITSLLLRLFNKILSSRLMKAAPLPKMQKGFAPEGVAANIFLVQELVKSAMSTNSPLCIAFIDFRKAFDSIGHPSLLMAARRWGIPPEICEFIGNLYKKAATNIMGEVFGIRRGVLQGDRPPCLPTSSTLRWTGRYRFCLQAWGRACMVRALDTLLTLMMLP